MKQKKKTLEDFIRNYISNNSLYGEGGYSDFVRKLGVNTDDEYRKSVQASKNSYASSLSGYGSNAEKIGSMGLNESGYSDYIDNLSKSKMEEALKSAENERLLNTEKNLILFKDAKEKEAEEALSKYNSTVSAIEKANIALYDEAYKFALTSGHSNEEADLAAKQATATVRKKIKDSVLKTIVEKTLTSAQTRKYAEGLGLPEEDIEELSSYAEKINESIIGSGNFDTKTKQETK